jgi:REP element-mobilizing transposase RayT
MSPVMSQPRSILPGATYLLTRRVLRRHLLLRPDAAITNLLVYALAVSARRYGIQVHAFCAMSTHLHLVVTDEQGLLPRFLAFFHRIVALGTKVLRAWEGPVWDHEATSAVRLTTREAVVQKIAYTLANPVAAGLVLHASEWPGAKVLASELGLGVLRAARPEVYFDASNPEWPDEATLGISLPPAIGAAEADDFRREVAAEVASEEAKAHAERQGAGVLGADRAVHVSPYERATSFEALRARNPTFAVGRGNGDAWRCAAAAVRSFRATYRAALERWCAGVRSVLFPAGTWWMRVLHAVGVSAEAPV